MLSLSLILAFGGLALLFLEFFLPGAVMGVLGGLALFASLVLFALTTNHFFSFFLFFLFLVLSSVIVVRLALKQLRRSKKWHSFYLDHSVESYRSSQSQKHLIGHTARAMTDLRPSGYILINNQSFQAVSSGDFVDKGTEIQIIEGRGAYLVVKKINRGIL